MMFDRYAAIYDATGQEWVGLHLLQQLRRWLAAEGLQPGSAADLACGGGAVAVALALSGLEVYGVDRSPQMLALARRRGMDSGVAVTWLEQDLRQLRLPRPVELITALYDSLNYLLSDEDLRLAIQQAAAELQPGGVCAFDLNTPNEYEAWSGGRDNVIHDSTDLLVLCRRSYSPETRIAGGRFIWMQREGDRWQRDEERQQQRAHADAEVVAALEAAGLLLRRRLTPQGEPADQQATRILYIAQKR